MTKKKFRIRNRKRGGIFIIYTKDIVDMDDVKQATETFKMFETAKRWIAVPSEKVTKVKFVRTYDRDE